MKLTINDIKYIKFEYTTNDNQVVQIKAFLKNYSEREIYAFAKNCDNIRFKYPAQIQLNIIAYDGLYKAKTTLKYVRFEEDYTYFALETPANAEYQQNREYFRVEHTTSCTYVIEENDIRTEQAAMLCDISASGISIFTDEYVPNAYAIILIKLQDEEICIPVKYIRSEKYENKYKLSFVYNEIPENIRDNIASFCIKKQIEQRRKSLR